MAFVYLGFAAATEAIHMWILLLAYGIYYSLVESKGGSEGRNRRTIASDIPDLPIILDENLDLIKCFG